MEIDPSRLDSAEIYKILIGSVLPRPIGWASTLSKDGIANLAPFSFFTVVSRKPPMVSLTIQPRSNRTQLKDTLINARETGEFVVNIVSFEQANQMHKTAAEVDPEVDEFTVAGLERIASAVVRPPRVAGAPVAMECKVETILPMGEVGDHLVIGRVERFHVRDDVWLDSGRLDTTAIRPVGRLAAEYAMTEQVFACPVPDTLLAEYSARRIRRIDGKPLGWSPIDEKSWSASGSVTLAK